MIKVFSYQGLPQREVEGCAKLFFFHSHQIKEARNTLRAVERRGRKGRGEGGREGGREGEREGGREGEREGGREGEKEEGANIHEP